VKLNLLVNAKSGICQEDCSYCSQSIVSTAPIEKYPIRPARPDHDHAHLRRPGVRG
jgi:biotin synthase-like enzyme